MVVVVDSLCSVFPMRECNLCIGSLDAAVGLLDVIDE